MQELAPQSKDGEYARPSYDLRGRIGSAEFPVSCDCKCLPDMHTINAELYIKLAA